VSSKDDDDLRAKLEEEDFLLRGRPPGYYQSAAYFKSEAYKKSRDKYIRSAKGVAARKRQARSNQVRRYGMTPQEYAEMLLAQGGVCAICKRPQMPEKYALAVDHDHDTGKVRALLCIKCNSAIALLDENLDILNAMTEYILKHKNLKGVE
jgi:hypothetical protein